MSHLESAKEAIKNKDLITATVEATAAINEDGQCAEAYIIRAQLNAVFATLVKGMELLAEQGVRARRFIGHGGLFKTPGVAQQVLASALGTPVDCPAAAGEGGAWGIAALAAYRDHVRTGGALPLADFLDTLHP